MWMRNVGMLVHVVIVMLSLMTMIIANTINFFTVDVVRVVIAVVVVVIVYVVVVTALMAMMMIIMKQVIVVRETVCRSIRVYSRSPTSPLPPPPRGLHRGDCLLQLLEPSARYRTAHERLNLLCCVVPRVQPRANLSLHPRDGLFEHLF